MRRGCSPSSRRRSADECRGHLATRRRPPPAGQIGKGRATPSPRRSSSGGISGLRLSQAAESVRCPAHLYSAFSGGCEHRTFEGNAQQWTLEGQGYEEAGGRCAQASRLLVCGSYDDAPPGSARPPKRRVVRSSNAAAPGPPAAGSAHSALVRERSASPPRYFDRRHPLHHICTTSGGPLLGLYWRLRASPSRAPPPSGGALRARRPRGGQEAAPNGTRRRVSGQFSVDSPRFLAFEQTGEGPRDRAGIGNKVPDAIHLYGSCRVLEVLGTRRCREREHEWNVRRSADVEDTGYGSREVAVVRRCEGERTDGLRSPGAERGAHINVERPGLPLLRFVATVEGLVDEAAWRK